LPIEEKEKEFLFMLDAL